MEISEGAVFQRRENGIYDDSRISEISYLTTLLDRRGSIYMGGMDGRRIDSCRVDVRLRVNADSPCWRSS